MKLTSRRSSSQSEKMWISASATVRFILGICAIVSFLFLRSIAPPDSAPNVGLATHGLSANAFRMAAAARPPDLSSPFVSSQSPAPYPTLHIGTDAAQHTDAGRSKTSFSPMKTDLATARSVAGGRATPFVAVPAVSMDEVMANSSPAALDGGQHHLASYLRLPMSFERNQGQAPGRYGYVTQGNGYGLELEPCGAHLSLFIPDPNNTEHKEKATNQANHPLRRNGHYAELQLSFVNASRKAKAEGLDLLPGKANHFQTNDPKTWFTNLPTYSRVAYRGVYPGIDVFYYGNQNQLEYDFVVSPGADPRTIDLQLLGSKVQQITSDGSVLARLDGAGVRFHKPILYQWNEKGEKQYVEGGYFLEAANKTTGEAPHLRFHIGNYDTRRELIIDPVLTYSTYENGFSGYIDSIALDSAGDAIILSGYGQTNISALSPDGTTLLFTTTLGSGNESYPFSLALDPSGNIAVTGEVLGTTWPTTTSGYQLSNAGNYDFFVTELNPTGANLVYSTYLGGSGEEEYSFIASDTLGKLYVAGWTYSTNFPTTAGAYQTTFSGPYSGATVAKLDPTLSGSASLIYSTYVTATASSSYVNALAVDSAGNAYIVGPQDNGFPITSGAFSFDGYESSTGGVYVTKVNPTGTQLVYSAYLGPGAPYGIAVDGSGAAYVTGTSSYLDFPATTGAYQAANAASPGAFVTKLSADGSTLIYSGFLNGPTGFTTPQSIALLPGCASNCAAYIVGYTTATDFTLNNPIQNAIAGSRNDFIVQLSADGTTAPFSTYFGGNSQEGDSFGSFQPDPVVAVDASGDIYFGGGTTSSLFPITIPTTQTNGFIAKIATTNAATGVAVPLSLNFGYEGIGITSKPQPLAFRNMGSAALTVNSLQVTGDFAETDNCVGTIAAGGNCTVNATFTPTYAGTRFGTITIADSGNNTPTVMNLQGTGQDGGDISWSPTILNFSPIAVGTSGAPQTVTLSNIGNLPVTVSSIYLNPATSNFSQTNNCPEVFSPGASCSVTVTFTPTAVGYLTATLTESDNGDGYGNYPVTLTGSAVETANNAGITLSSTGLVFPPQLVGSTSPYQYVELTSTGASPVSFTNVSIAGSNASDFAIYLNTCTLNTNLTPGSSCYVYVNFTPAATGPFSATLSITEDGVVTPLTVALSGTGTASTSSLVVTPTSLVYPTQVVGTSSSIQYVDIYNVGTAPITLQDFSDAPEFPLTISSCPLSLSPGSSCYVGFVFDPAAAGTRTATVNISSSAGSQALSFTGMGALSASAVVPAVDALAFAPQVVGTTSGAQVVYFYDTGNVPVTGITASISGAPFALLNDSCTGLSIAVGSYCYVNVVFSPATTAAGPQTGTLNFTSSAGTLTGIPLTGTGVATASAIEPSASSIAFGPQVQNTSSAAQILYFYNTGDVPLGISSTVPSGPFALAYDGCTGNTIQPGGYCYVSVTFTPTTTGMLSGAVTLSSSGLSTSVIVSLTGTGVSVLDELEPSVSGIVFGPQPVGTTSQNSQQIILTNAGNIPVTITTDTPTGDFGVTTDGCAGNTVQPNGVCYLYVSFTPTASGLRTGTLTITSSDLSGPPPISLSGNGILATQTLLFIPASMNFGSIVTSLTGSQNIDVSNTGSEVVTLGATPTSTGDYAISSNGCGGSGTALQPGSTCTLALTFTPGTTGTLTGTLSVPSSASSSPQSVNLTGSGVSSPPAIAFAPNALAFAPQPIGTSPSPQTITVQYNATGSVTINNISVSGEYQILSQNCGTPPVTLNTPTTCSVNINFTPTVAGDREGTLQITDTLSGSPHQATLDGNGLTSNNAAITNPSGLVFTDQPQGTTSANYQTVNLINTGNVALNNITVAFNNADFTQYVYPYQCGSYYTSLTPGQSCPVYVYFTPTAVGARSGTITFTDSATNSPQTVSLSGNGSNNITTAIVNPVTVVFTDQPQGTTSASYQTVNLTNTGNVPLNNITVTFSGTDFTQYVYPYQCGTAYYPSLAPGQSCPVYVYFTPTAVGARSGTITFTDSATNSPQTVSLTGNGITATPAAVANPKALGFVDQPQGTTSASYQTVSLLNTGNVPLSNITVTFSDADFTQYVYPYQCGPSYYASLTPGQSCPVYVYFTPTGVGARSGTITLTESYGTQTLTQTVALSGKGLTPNSAAVVSPTAMPFADQPQGTTSASYQTVSLLNTGNVPLSNITVTFSDADFTQYSYAAQCGSYYTSLTPGQSCPVYVYFTPTGVGARSGAITLTESYGTQTLTQTVALSGKGLATNNSASVTPSSLAFPPQTLNVASYPLSLTYTNTGNVPLAVSSVNATANFSISYNTCSTVSPGLTCTIQVTFTPTSAGSITGTLTINDNSATPSHAIPLSGTGITTSQAILLSQTSVNFGNVVTNTTSNPVLVYYYNQGSSNVQITNFAISSPFSMSGSQCYLTTYGAGSSCYLNLTFSPTATGSASANLIITDTATGSPRTIALTGTGISPYPIVSLTPLGGLAFSSENIGTTSGTQTVMLKNAGTANLTFSAPTFTGANPGDFAIYSNGCASPLVPSGYCYIYITFSPGGTGSRSALLNLSSNATPSVNQLNLAGTGVAAGPAAVLSPDNLSFSTTNVGTSSAPQNIQLSNPGNATLNIASIATSPNFTQTNNCASTLAASSSCTISVTFSPTSTGNLQGYVTVTDNAGNNPQKASLSGTGNPTPPVASLTPSNLVFSNQPITVSSSAQPIQLTNTGSGSLNISSIAITGTNAGDFGQTNNCQASLTGGLYCTIEVTFTPTAAGTRTAAVSVTDNASGSPQSVPISGSGQLAPLVTLSPSSLTFPNINVGSSSAPLTVGLQNTGTATLTVSSIALYTGANASQFSIGNNTCITTLAISASCSFTVTFSPTQAGSDNWYISITDNAYNSPQSLTLTATGIGAVATPSQGSLIFPAQAIGTTSVSQPITLYSQGNVALSISSITASTNFGQTNNCPTGTATLAVGANCTINVTFTPSTAGTLTGTLAINDNEFGSPQTVALSGLGSGAVVQLVPTTLSFNNQATGSTSAPQTVTLTNTGNQTLSITSIYTNDGEYAIVNNLCGSTLAALASCTLQVTFSPSTTGSRPASLFFSDNAPGTPQAVPLSGTGTAAPLVSLSFSSLGFGTQNVGTTSSSQNVILTNTGNAPLTISAIAFSPPSPANFLQTNNCPVSPSSLAAGGNCTFTISFTPTAVGALSASIVITDNAATSPQSIALSGTGAGVSGVQLSTSSLTFPSQSLGVPSSAQSFTVTNNGTATLTFNSPAISVTGTNAGDFSQNNNCISPLAVGGFCTVNVTFTPTASGSRIAIVSISDNATSSPQSVALAGTGAESTQQTWTLTVTDIGTGNGTVTDNLQQIDCITTAGVQSGTCSASYTAGTPVTLTATPSGNTTFAGWGGACTGTTSCVVTMNSAQSVTASFTPPPQQINVTFSSGTTVSGMATYDCPSNPNPTPTNPCTDPNAHALALSIPQVLVPFTVTVQASEVPPSMGNGICPNGDTPTQDFDCRFVTFFTYQTNANGDKVVPLCYPYANGNCVHYQIFSGTPGVEPNPSNYVGPIDWEISWNNDAFVPPAPYTGSIPQLYDDPDYAVTPTSPYGTDCTTPMLVNGSPTNPAIYCQFEFNITTAYLPNKKVDAGITGRTKQFNDVAVAFPPANVGNLTITDVPLSPSVVAGSSIGYTITVTNSAGGAVTGATLTDALPAGTNVNWTISPTYAGPGTCAITGTVGAQELSCSFGTITASQTFTIGLLSVSSSIGTYTDTTTTVFGTQQILSIATLTVQGITATFSNLTPSQTIQAGSASITLSGAIGNGEQFPVGETVSIAIGSVTQQVTIGNAGAFSTVFQTSALPASSTPYPITYSYAGDGTFTPATDSSTTLTVTAPPAQFTLTVTDIGTGNGTVTDNLQQIDCITTAGVQSGTCSASYTAGTPVTLTATPSGNTTFAGWGGACTGTTSCVVTMNSAQSVTASFTPPPQQINVTFSSGTTVSGMATYDCPSNPNPTPTNPCTDPNAHALALSIPQVLVPFTVTVQASEVPPSMGNGICPNGDTPTQDFDCRFVTFFTYQTNANGDKVVPLCYPYANGNCVHYQIFSGTPGVEPNPSNYVGPIDWEISWNNDAFVPPAPYTGSIPQLYDDPDYAVTPTSPYGTDCTTPMLVNGSPTNPAIYCQFEFNITTAYLPNKKVDAGITGRTKQFNDVAVAFPPANVGNLTITDVPLSPSVVAGSSIGYTITVTNSAGGAVTGATLTDALPAGTNVNWTISPTYAGPGTCAITGTVGAQELSCSFGTITASQTFTIGLLSVSSSIGTYTDTTTTVFGTQQILSIATLTVQGITATFSNLTPSQTIQAGSASITLSGAIGNGEQFPVGETVSIAIGSVTQQVTIGNAGAFSTVFQTSALPASSTPYPITYSYAGDGTFTPATDSSTTLTVTAPPAQFTLTVTDIGTGNGTVTDNLQQIDCITTAGVQSGTCSASYTAGTPVTLTATPSGNTTFAGWGGACTGTTSCVVTMNSAQSVTASFTPPPQQINVTFSSGTTVSGMATYDCPSNPNPTPTNPCTDPNAHALALSIPQVLVPFTVTVQASEVPPSMGNGICPNGDTPTQDFDCRFVTFFTYQTNANGDKVVPLCYPYANGNCVHYQIFSGTPGVEPNPSNYVGPIDWEISWNNDAFVPPAPYTGSIPQLYDDPDYAVTPTSPYGTDCTTPMLVNGSPTNPAIYCQFEFNITTAYLPNKKVDAGITGRTKQFNDVAVAFPPANVGNLTITDVPLSPSVVAGSSIGYTITVTNSAGGAVTGATLTDALPAGTNVNWTISPTYAGPGTCAITGTVGAQELSCSFGTITASQTFTIGLLSVSSSIGTYTDTTTTVFGTQQILSIATLTVQGITATFSNLTPSQTIQAGSASITLSGAIGNGEQFPVGETVSIAIGSVTQQVTIGNAGAFSTVFQTSALPASSTPYPITYSYAGDGTFTPATDSSTTLTVTALASQTITFTGTPASATYNTTFSATATASSGLPVTITASGVCSISGSTVTMTSGTGTCTLTASQSGNATYGAAVSIVNTVTATLAQQTITIGSTPATATYDTSFSVTASSNSLLVVTITASGVCSIGSGSITMTSGTGNCTITASQLGNTNYAAAQTTRSVAAQKAASTTTISSDAPNPSTVSQAVAVVFNVTGVTTPTGTVTVTASTGESCSASLASGSGSCSITFSTVGIRALAANYGGDTNFNTSASVSVSQTVNGSSTSGLVISPASLDLGQVPLGGLALQEVSLSNTGKTAIAISTVGLSSIGSGDFHDFFVLNICPKNLAPAGRCALEVGYQPNGNAPVGTTVSTSVVITDTAAGSPQSVPVQAQPINPKARLSSVLLAFGNQKVGTTSKGITATLTNIGTSALNLGSVRVTGDFALVAGTTCAGGMSLVPSHSCTLVVEFEPSRTGLREGAVTIRDNALIGEQVILLIGNGN